MAGGKMSVSSITLALIVTVHFPTIATAFTPAIQRLMNGETLTVTVKSAAYNEFLYPAHDKSSLLTMPNSAKKQNAAGLSGHDLSQYWRASGCYTWNGQFRIALTSMRFHDLDNLYLTTSTESYKQQGRQVKLESYPVDGFMCPVGAKWIPSNTGVNSTVYPDRVRLGFVDNGKFLYATVAEKPCKDGTECDDTSDENSSQERSPVKQNKGAQVRRALIWPGPDDSLEQEHHWDIVLATA